MTAMRMPWTLRTMPHGTLDILRGCNIRCRACYNTKPAHIKSLSQIEQDLDQLLANRKLHTLTITGGEPTLHPQLEQIVQLVRQRGLVPALITNGMLLDDNLLWALKHAGLKLVILHIDPGQQRDDLPYNATCEQVNEHRRRKAALVASHGIEAGLVTTVYRSKMQDLVKVTRLVLNSPDIQYLLVANCSHVGQIASLSGDLNDGIQREDLEVQADDGMADELVEPAQAMQCLQETLRLYPFGYLGSNLDPDDPRWISYMVSTVSDGDAPAVYHALRSSLTERIAIHLTRLIRGRFVYHQDQSTARLRTQLLLNAVTGGHFMGNLRMLWRSLRRRHRLQAKHVLIMAPGGLTGDGQVVYCRDCPDATIHDGRLVPPCLSDRFDFTTNQVRCSN